MLARERSDHGFSGESRCGHACRERLPQAGLRGSHRRWIARLSLSGRPQGSTARHVTTPTPERYFSTEYGATLEEIHSGRIRLLLASKAVVFTGTAGGLSATRTKLRLITQPRATSQLAGKRRSGHFTPQ